MLPKLEKILEPIEEDIEKGKNISQFISSSEELEDVLKNLKANNQIIK